jgi:hypothetical protein
MEKNELNLPISATEAKELALKNSITLTTITNQIKSNVATGMRNARFYDVYISTDIVQKLLELGYAISLKQGQFGEEIYIISWL